MNLERLHLQVSGELDQMHIVIEELIRLKEDIGDSDPTLREVVAAGAFIGQFYNGIENILKRLAVFSGLELPSSERWHSDLLEQFAETDRFRPDKLPFPLLDDELFNDLKSFLGFRHVVRMGYGMDLDWNRISAGIEIISSVFKRFRDAVLFYLDKLAEE